MSVAKLRDWMDKNRLTVIEVAAITKIHTNTIYRYLAGKSVHHLTEDALERLTRTDDVPMPRGKVAG